MGYLMMAAEYHGMTEVVSQFHNGKPTTAVTGSDSMVATGLGPISLLKCDLVLP